jgi:cell division protease FtsH
MICLYGMGESVGLVHCGQEPSPFLPVPGDGMIQRDFSEETTNAVDKEVRTLLDGAYAESKQILLQHRDQLNLVAGELLEHETLDTQTFKNLIEKPTVAA